MSLSPELLEILRCPKCKSKVEQTEDKSGLRCVNAKCRLVYPIREDIPVMLVEEAKTMDSGKW
ncbi:MAG: Trm112 family protein [Pyrinomonadaceae bacterium]